MTLFAVISFGRSRLGAPLTDAFFGRRGCEPTLDLPILVEPSPNRVDHLTFSSSLEGTTEPTSVSPDALSVLD